jgi:hypothetical protein
MEGDPQQDRGGPPEYAVFPITPLAIDCSTSRGDTPSAAWMGKTGTISVTAAIVPMTSAADTMRELGGAILSLPCAAYPARPDPTAWKPRADGLEP